VLFSLEWRILAIYGVDKNRQLFVQQFSCALLMQVPDLTTFENSQRYELI
jgi:hypothetical protein